MADYEETIVSKKPIQQMIESGMPNYYKIDAIHTMLVAAMNKDRRSILQMILDMKLVETSGDFERGFNSALDSIFHIVYSGEYRT